MKKWLRQLKYGPLPPLLSSEDEVIIYFSKRDIAEKTIEPIEYIWNLPIVKKIIKKQQPDGSWKPKKKKDPSCGVKYELVETWRHLRVLVEQYEFSRKHPVIENAAEFLLSHQTKDGNIRGILANQYTPYYMGAIMSLLIKAGYINDLRIEKGFKWLLSMRQDDGGWVIGSPGMVGIQNLSTEEMIHLTSQKDAETAKSFDRTKPFSAAGTGMIIRAFSAHPYYRKSDEAKQAGRLLKSKFFRKDNWSSYQHPENWVRFQYPYWWNHLVAALDSLSMIGFSYEDKDIKNALNWLQEHQLPNGLWKSSYSKKHIDKEVEIIKKKRVIL